MQSIIQEMGNVRFPTFTGERVYMEPVFRDKALPEHLTRWQETFDDMMADVDVDGPVYLMIDQKIVKAGNTHRRGGLHIDGFWVPGGELLARCGGYDTGPHYSTMFAGKHLFERTTPGHKTQYQIDLEREQEREEADKQKRIKRRLQRINDKRNAGAMERPWPNETIILASDVPACRALVGEWDGYIAQGGDVSHLDLSHMREVMMTANKAYAGNVTFVHESLPVPYDCQRTVVRINVPGHIIH